MFATLQVLERLPVSLLSSSAVVADEDMYGAFPNERKQYLRECQDDVNNLYMNLRSVFISPDPE